VGVIHADLKPDNILLDKKTDEPIIIDFGNSNFDTQTYFQWSGTEGYIPPTIYKSRECHSYDIWSLAEMFGLSVSNRPSHRPCALDLIHHEDEIKYEYDNYRPASPRSFSVDESQYFKMETLPVIQLTMHQKTNLFNFYGEFDAKKTLLAVSFSHMSYTNMKSLTQLMFGVTRLEKIKKIKAPEFNILRWMKRHGLTNYNQVLWSLMVGETLDVEQVKKFPTTRFNRSFIVPVDKACYKCSVDSISEIALLKLFLERMVEENPEARDNYDLFCSKFQ
jgi:serine/threonine protein kinase